MSAFIRVLLENCRVARPAVIDLHIAKEEALGSAASVLPEFTGRAIHDHLAAYYKFSQAQHGACNAHILRELQGLREWFGVG